MRQKHIIKWRWKMPRHSRESSRAGGNCPRECVYHFPQRQERSLLASSLYKASIFLLQVLAGSWPRSWVCCSSFWPLARWRCWPSGDARRWHPRMTGTTGMAVSTQITLCFLWAKGQVQGSSWWCQSERWKMTLQPRCSEKSRTNATEESPLRLSILLGSYYISYLKY